MLKAKRLDVVEQLDRLVVALSVYSYFGDPSFLLLFLRIAVQTQLSRPQEFAHRTLPFFFRFVTTFFLGSLLRHYTYGPRLNSEAPSGVFLDFVGQSTPTSTMAVIAQTILIYFLQVVCLAVAYETGHSPPPRDLPHPFFLVAPPAPSPSSPSASPSGRALEDLEAQPATTSEASTEDRSSWVPYTDFLSPAPEPPPARGRTGGKSARAKGAEPERSASPSPKTSLLLPSVPADAEADAEAPYLPVDTTSLYDSSEAPVFALRPISLLSRLLGVGPYARLTPNRGPDGETQSDWETFWNGAGTGGMREGLALGFGAAGGGGPGRLRGG